MIFEFLVIFFLFLATSIFVSVFINFLNRDDKRLPWKNVFSFAVIFTFVFCGIAAILNYFS